MRRRVETRVESPCVSAVYSVGERSGAFRRRARQIPASWLPQWLLLPGFLPVLRHQHVGGDGGTGKSSSKQRCLFLSPQRDVRLHSEAFARVKVQAAGLLRLLFVWDLAWVQITLTSTPARPLVALLPPGSSGAAHVGP